MLVVRFCLGGLAKRVAVMQVLVVTGFCLGKTRGGTTVAVTQVLVVRFCVLAKRVAATQVLAVRFLSWRLGKTSGGGAGACGHRIILSWQNAWR